MCATNKEQDLYLLINTFKVELNVMLEVGFGLFEGTKEEAMARAGSIRSSCVVYEDHLSIVTPHDSYVINNEEGSRYQFIIDENDYLPAIDVDLLSEAERSSLINDERYFGDYSMIDSVDWDIRMAYRYLSNVIPGQFFFKTGSLSYGVVPVSYQKFERFKDCSLKEVNIK
ncbi:hypothetical protein ABE060_22300 [Bacillus rugosus]|uniref:Uncharacterized protein n=1 Tax=Bacillus subtilis TaxID=1423 RepID=B7U599_BACIU|nr:MULTISPECIES: hypothetical protein [Bacillus]ACJ66902.1 hypothetical protein Bsb_22 [Bacillus subtilis]APB62308.1 hypothetical protein pBS72_0390 [Bacillus subtilis]NUF07795.1 hypothetical protein [Bacillus rugosus]